MSLVGLRPKRPEVIADFRRLFPQYRHTGWVQEEEGDGRFKYGVFPLIRVQKEAGAPV